MTDYSSTAAPSDPLAKLRRSGLAALLSLLCPGLGQFYNEQYGRAIVAFLSIVLFSGVIGTLLLLYVPPDRLPVIVGAVALVVVVVLLMLAIVVDAILVGWRLGGAPSGKWQRARVYVILVIVWLGLAIGSGFWFGQMRLWNLYSTPSGANLPTLAVGDYFVAWRGYYSDREPGRGDLVVLEHPKDAEADFVKRIVGLPGDRIRIKGGRLYLDGAMVEREILDRRKTTDAEGREIEAIDYLETLPGGPPHRIREESDQAAGDETAEVEVPPDHYFVLGDNRDRSLDSRAVEALGFVPRGNLRGFPTFIIWSVNKGRLGWSIQPVR